ncbi:MAG: F0F1 ATP synthase subunit B [Candidatus Omnitrophota bacterium]|nr:MAG: F0F1 ATP synthase subunit B [Candidatus Omnitrophota bacterium]
MNINLTLILEIVIFVILLLLLQRFVFRHLLQMLERRKSYVENNLVEIEKLKKETGHQAQQAQEQLEEAKRRALQIKEEANTYSQEYRGKKKVEAEKEIVYMKKKAEKEIAFQLEKSKQKLQQHSLELSFMIAEKILKKEIDHKKHAKLLQESLKELYEAQ